MNSANPLSHVQQVRYLYKTILRLHRGLPVEARVLGDLYVKEEFKRHKTATPEQAQLFLNEWTNYAVTLTKQLQPKNLKRQEEIGKDFTKENLDLLSDEQVVQLHELRETVVPNGNNEKDGGNR